MKNTEIKDDFVLKVILIAFILVSVVTLFIVRNVREEDDASTTTAYKFIVINDDMLNETLLSDSYTEDIIGYDTDTKMVYYISNKNDVISLKPYILNGEYAYYNTNKKRIDIGDLDD